MSPVADPLALIVMLPGGTLPDPDGPCSRSRYRDSHERPYVRRRRPAPRQNLLRPREEPGLWRTTGSISSLSCAPRRSLPNARRLLWLREAAGPHRHSACHLRRPRADRLAGHGGLTVPGVTSHAPGLPALVPERPSGVFPAKRLRQNVNWYPIKVENSLF